jgi:hypothetical protein
MLKDVKEGYSNVSREEVKKYFNRGVEDSVRTIELVFSFVNVQTEQITVCEMKDASSNKELVVMSEICYHNLKFIEQIHSRISEDLYKLLNILSTLNLTNSLNNTQITSICLNKFPEISLLYNNNFN